MVSKHGKILVTGWLNGDEEVGNEKKHSMKEYKQGLAPLKMREKVQFGDKWLMLFDRGERN